MARDRFACAAPDCVVFFWTTIQHLAIALEVMKLRGFEYKSHYVCAKPRISLGRWTRSKHEILPIGTRGHVPCPAPGTQWESIVSAPHPGPFLKIELNARQARRGWDRWGLDAPAEAIDGSTPVEEELPLSPQAPVAVEEEPAPTF